MRSLTSIPNTPTGVVNVTRADHSLNRPGSPSPFPQIRELVTSSVTFCFAGIEEGTTMLTSPLRKPTSLGNPWLASIVAAVLTVVIETEMPEGIEASTRTRKGRRKLLEPFSQLRAGVPNRAPLNVSSESPPTRRARTVAPAATTTPPPTSAALRPDDDL